MPTITPDPSHPTPEINIEAAEGGARTPPATPTTRMADPAPDPTLAARQRAIDFVHNICTVAQLSLRERRDDLDNLMARMTESETALSHYIGEFTSFSADVMRAAEVMKSEIAEIAKPFAGSPPSTITQLKNGKDTQQ